MAISLKPARIKRYSQLARLLIRYGRADIVRTAGLDATLNGTSEDLSVVKGTESERAESLARDLERLGPTYIKIGQLLSTRPDLLSPPYLKALSRLQDHVVPFESAAAEEILSEELGVRVSKAFRKFETEPLASASLGQVHYAELRDGQPVAVKIQRPGIRDRVTEDLGLLEDLAAILDEHSSLGERYDLRGIVRDFRRTIFDELDYRREAANLERLGANLERFERLVVPAPVQDYTTSRVLTMEFVKGRRITEMSPLSLQEIDGRALADQIFEAYLQQILVDGFYHADPHPGNLFLTTDGKVAFLDLGMVSRVTPSLQDKLVRFLMAVADGDGEAAARTAITLGDPSSDFDEAGFIREASALVARYGDTRVEDLQVGGVVLEVSSAAGNHGMRVPPDLTMLAKTLLNLDRVGRTLDPDFEPNRALRRHVGGVLRRRIQRGVSPSQMLATFLEMNELVQELPRRLNLLLDRMAGNQFEIKVDALDEVHLIRGLQKIANRITVGLILASLIIGAAILTRVETDFSLLGYPGLAILLLLVAVVGAALLLGSILLTDE